MNFKDLLELLQKGESIANPLARSHRQRFRNPQFAWHRQEEADKDSRKKWRKTQLK